MPLPPGSSLPAVAQIAQFTYRPLEYFDVCLARFGDPFTVRMGPVGTYVGVVAPELIKQVFTADTDTLRAGEANAILEPVVGRHSVLLLDGPRHLRQRRLLLPPLHGERMQTYSRIMADATADSVARMPTGAPFAIHAHMQEITLRVILRAVFGLDEGATLRDLEARLIEFLKPPPAAMTFVPVRYLDFPLSPYRTFVRRRDAVDVALREVLRARRAAGVEGRTDILSLLMAARDEEGKPLTDDELRDELVTMLVAGHETSATALSWTVACLLENPAVAAKLDAELDAARDDQGGLDLSALPRLEYLDAVVKESLRLRPILPDVVRKVRAPMKVAGYEIPVGVNLMPCVYLAHQRAEAWPEPRRFRPERFVGAKVDPYTWFPFGGGVRRCVGMAFALHEMKVVLAELWLRARLSLHGPVKVVRRTITMAPSGGTRVTLVERRRAPRRGLSPTEPTSL